MSAKSKSGFTLVELLVVVSIILLLLSLTMPALRSALDRGRVQKCQSNLRSLVIASTLFYGDHGGNLPYGCNDNVLMNYRMSASGAMAIYPNYLNDHTAFFCPGEIYRANRHTLAAFQSGYHGWGIRSSYGSRLLQRRRSVNDPALEGDVWAQIFPSFHNAHGRRPIFRESSSVRPPNVVDTYGRVWLVSSGTVVLTEKNVNQLGNPPGSTERGYPDHPNSRFHDKGINAARLDGSSFFTPWETLLRENGSWIVGEDAFVVLERQ